MKLVLRIYSEVIERWITFASVPLTDTDSDVVIYYPPLPLSFVVIYPQNDIQWKMNIFLLYPTWKIKDLKRKTFFFVSLSLDLREGQASEYAARFHYAKSRLGVWRLSAVIP